jgi:hypothetical protein
MGPGILQGIAVSSPRIYPIRFSATGPQQRRGSGCRAHAGGGIRRAEVAITRQSAIRWNWHAFIVPAIGLESIQDRTRNLLGGGHGQLRHPQNPQNPQNPADPRPAGQRPRWHVHLTPTSSSWLNQIERLFALPTDKKDTPRRPSRR